MNNIVVHSTGLPLFLMVFRSYSKEAGMGSLTMSQRSYNVELTRNAQSQEA